MDPVELPVETIQRRCGTCHGSEPDGKPRIGVGHYFTFGGPGPALPLVHELADLAKIRGDMGYFKFGRSRPPQSLCNLTHPAKSLLVRAPLSVQAGGLGLCRPGVFADGHDPDLVEILASIESAAARHQVTKRFDMPGFRPNDHYVIQMQRFGVLQKDLKPDDPIDFRRADEAYWKSFRYRGHGEKKTTEE
jgi:hypothetical protein